MSGIVRITANERLFLATCALSGSASTKELAKLSGLKEHAVRYARDSLLEQGAIKPVWQVDPYILGFLEIATYFNRGSESSKGRAALEQKLIQHPKVSWLAKMGGTYQYGTVVYLRKMIELDRLFSLIRPTDSGAHFDKTVRIGLDWTVYTPSYLAPTRTPRQSIVMTSENEVVEVDKTDEKILRALAQHPHESLATIARSLSMTQSAFSYRFNRLSEQKVVRGLTYIVQMDKLRISTYRIFIVDRGLNEERKLLLKKTFANHPNVVAALSCTGNWDYELRFETENPEDVDQFCALIYDTFGSGIDSINVSQQFKILKRVAHPLA